MKTALIAVDVQKDFYLPDGALSVEGGIEIIHPLTLVARDVDLVIASRDWHPPDHISFGLSQLIGDFKRWPVHCVQDTPGAQLHPRIRRLANYVISKGMDPNEDSYSAFNGRTLRPVNTLEKILKDQGIQRVIVGGLAMDYCVRHTALDANALGLETIVPLDCTRSISRGKTQTLNAFHRAGVKVQKSWRA